LKLRARLLERGVLLRPLGSTVYIMPPYCTTKDELKSVYRAVSDVVDEVLA
jgi:adenosylmethionine-8-amino-7-oxononanoate aminotransferase